MLQMQGRHAWNAANRGTGHWSRTKQRFASGPGSPAMRFCFQIFLVVGRLAALRFKSPHRSRSQSQRSHHRCLEDISFWSFLWFLGGCSYCALLNCSVSTKVRLSPLTASSAFLDPSFGQEVPLQKPMLVCHAACWADSQVPLGVSLKFIWTIADCVAGQALL